MTRNELDWTRDCIRRMIKFPRENAWKTARRFYSCHLSRQLIIFKGAVFENFASSWLKDLSRLYSIINYACVSVWAKLVTHTHAFREKSVILFCLVLSSFSFLCLLAPTQFKGENDMQTVYEGDNDLLGRVGITRDGGSRCVWRR